LYGSDTKTVTVRAEVARLRRTVGDLVAAQPYRLAADARADFLDVERLLRRGDVDAAVDLYAGPLLPSSRAPAIVAARARLESALTSAVREGANPQRDRRRKPRRSVGRERRLSGHPAEDACARAEGVARRQNARSGV
jgi:hypothetical protein